MKTQTRSYDYVFSVGNIVEMVATEKYREVRGVVIAHITSPNYPTEYFVAWPSGNRVAHSQYEIKPVGGENTL